MLTALMTYEKQMSQTHSLREAVRESAQREGLARLFRALDPLADTEDVLDGCSGPNGVTKRLGQLRAARARYALQTSDGLLSVTKAQSK